MPVSRADYEMAAEDAVKPSLVEATPDARMPASSADLPRAPLNEGAAVALNDWAAAVLAATAAMEQFMGQLNGVGQGAAPPSEPVNVPTASQRGDAQNGGAEAKSVQAAPEEPSEPENKVSDDFPVSTFRRAFKNTIDAAESRARNHVEEMEELEALLHRAIDLLDRFTSQPGLRDAATLQQQINNIEQRLASGAYPQ